MYSLTGSERLGVSFAEPFFLIIVIFAPLNNSGDSDRIRAMCPVIWRKLGKAHRTVPVAGTTVLSQTWPLLQSQVIRSLAATGSLVTNGRLINTFHFAQASGAFVRVT